MHFDWSIPGTLLTYLRWALGADRAAREAQLPVALFLSFEILVAAALIWFVGYKLRRREWLVLFFLGWFLIVLAPVLPLRNHITDYYLTIPAIGLAMLGAGAFAEAWKSRTALRAAAVIVLLLYAIPSAWLAQAETRNYYTSSQRVRHLVQRVAYAHRLPPDKIFFIKGVDSSLFWTAFHDTPFRLFGRTQIYITPEVEHQILRTEEQKVSQHFLPEDLVLELIRAKKAIVYETAGHRLRNVTNLYGAMLESEPELELPAWIDAGSPVFRPYLGEGWYSADKGIRWSEKRATFRLRGPSSRQAYLRISGWLPPARLTKGPLSVQVTVNGHALPSTRIEPSDTGFDLTYPLPGSLAGRHEMAVAIEVNRTVMIPPDARPLGLAFGRMEVIP
jgi:hypothetical protein